MLDKTKFYRELEQILELSEGTVRGNLTLKDIPEWDSLAVVSFVGLADDTYGVILEPKKIENCLIVDDLAQLIESKQ
jgi:acyl carrier protein